jgi:hypothetical protein
MMNTLLLFLQRKEKNSSNSKNGTAFVILKKNSKLKVFINLFSLVLRYS